MAADNFPQDDVGSVPNCWPHRLAVLTTAATFLLILAGGVVTNTGTGMAVPDWPTTFGYNMFLYPLSRMTGGVYYEHAHRLFGSLVGDPAAAALAARCDVLDAAPPANDWDGVYEQRSK